MKVCCTCKVEKLLSDYNKCLRNKDGCRSTCRECQRIEGKSYKLNNVEKEKIRSAKYSLKNKDKLKVYRDKYRIENKEKEKLRSKKYRDENKEKCTIATKKWEALNPDKKRKHALDSYYRLDILPHLKEGDSYGV